MADDNNMKANIEVVATTNEKNNEQVGKKLAEGVKKGVGNNGYIELNAHINYKYNNKKDKIPASTVLGNDFSRLQKAQDKLLSNWEKLSDKGFSSDNKLLYNTLKAYRDWQHTVISHYNDASKEAMDPRVKEIRTVIGTQLKKYFTRLVDSGKDLFTVDTNEEFERKAKLAIKRSKAAQLAGVDLSKGEGSLSSKDRDRIYKIESEMDKRARAKKSVEDRKYAAEHAEETIKAEEKQLRKIRKGWTKQHENAIPITPTGTPLEDVALTKTKPKKYRNNPGDYEDYIKNERFLSNLATGAKTRNTNVPNDKANNINLGYREQAWNPIYLMTSFLRRMERGGTYVDTNSLLRQTMAYLPEAKKRASESLVAEIDKDKAMAKFNTWDKRYEKQFDDIEAKTGMSRLLLTNVAKVQGGLIAGREDTTAQDLEDAINIALADAVKNGKSAIAAENYNKGLRAVISMLQNRFDNMKDSMGGVDEEKYPNGRGGGIRLDYTKQVLKEIFKGMNDTSQILLDRAIKQYPEFYGEKTTKNNKRLKETQGSIFDKLYAEKLKEVQNVLNNKLEDVSQGVGTLINAIETSAEKDYIQQVHSDSREGKADDAEAIKNQKLIDIEEENKNTGVNTDENTRELIDAVKESGSGETKPSKRKKVKSTENILKETLSEVPGVSGSKCPCESILSNILKEIIAIHKYMMVIVTNLFKETGKTEVNEVEAKTEKTKKTEQPKITEKTFNQILETLPQDPFKTLQDLGDTLEEEIEGSLNQILMTPYTKLKPKEKFNTTSSFIKDTLKNIFARFSASSQAERFMNASENERAKETAARMNKYGMTRDLGDLSGTGQIAAIRYIKGLWRGRDKVEQGDTLFQDISKTDSISGIDTDKILQELRKAIQDNMFTAQTGGIWSNLEATLTGGLAYTWQPSLEASRAEAEGLNQVMANIKNKVLKLVEDVNAYEDIYANMDDKSSAAAQKVLVDLENRKDTLRSSLAEVKNIDAVVKRLGGNVHNITRELYFTMPELREENVILKNIGQGLDKNGKALKFQRRSQEILNYSFQLMARSVGQMIKNWMMMLNPINLIKKAFHDFASYDIKWQRTMNVIKYNIRAIIKPFMQWLAQTIVNIIGFVDIISMKIQAAFGKVPISLFDQAAANTEKMKEDFERINNVTAGFDELHDIGADNTGANDLLGDIYKPQLSEGWQNFADKLGDIFAGIAKAIKWCIDNWKLFVGLLAAYTVGKGLLNLLGLFNSLSLLPWGAIAKGLVGIAGALSLIYAGYNSIKLGFDWDQMDDQEKNSTIGKSIGFGALGGALVGGLIGSIGGPAGIALGATIGAGIGTAIFGGINSAIADYNGDDTRAEITAAIGGAGLGAAIGTLIAPGIGTAIGAAIGGGISWGLEKIGHELFSTGGAFSNLKISEKDLAWVTEQTTKAQQKQVQELMQLKQIEEQVGQSGEYLYNLVDSGKVSYDNLSASQIALVEQYKKYKSASEEVTAWVKKSTDYTLAMEKENARATGSFDELVKGMIKAKDDGIYTEEELRDRLAQVYGEIRKNQRDVFINSIPEDMRESVELQGQNYISGWEKFTVTLGEKWNEFKTNWKDFWDGVYSIPDKIGEAIKTLLNNIWSSIKIDASDAWDKIKDTAIGQKLQDIWNNVTSTFNRLKNILDEKWNSIKEGASKGWQNIKNAITGWLEDLWSSITKVFDGIASAAQNLWERICNFFSGKGFKTNEQVDSKGGKNISIQPYQSYQGFAVGTNYVPSDGLAYLHQGEAVIPKKYNTPYQPNNSGLEDAINSLNRQVERISNKVDQGIAVKGQFVQRGNDLVATVERANNKLSNNILNNKIYAR